MPSPLEETRIIDLTTGPVGGIATMVLSDFGADVIKIEAPGGDRFRSLAAAPMWLRGKRSAVLDLTTAEGRQELVPLIESADVVVATGGPERIARFGLSAEDVIALNPSVVHCALSAFGANGPYADYPGYEGLVSAKSGRGSLFARQLRRAGPGYPAVPIASHAAAFGAVQGICAGLLCREQTGMPQRVEASLLQGLLPYDLVSLLLEDLAVRGDTTLDPMAIGGDMPTLNYHPVLAKDGRWIQCGNILEHLFMNFLGEIDLLAELLVDERFQDSSTEWSSESIEIARDRILLRMREKTADEWMSIFHANGNIAAEPYRDTADSIDHPDLVENGSIVTLDDPVLGPIRQLGPIARLSETPGQVNVAAPRIGEHTDEILAEVRTRRSIENKRPDIQGRPLDGVTVVDFASIIAAPLATTMLADLGARVIKVETLAGDPYRVIIPGGLGAAKTNAGKSSICVDLKTAEGREIAHALVRQADVLVHNFRPGVPEKLGIGYAQVKELRPDIIWVSALGYGPDGPSAKRPATHPVAGAAMGGAALQAGPALRRNYESLEEIREGSRQLMRANEANPDPNTSCVLASAILLGLLVRQRHGVGQAIHVDMLLANAYANADDFLDYAGKPSRVPVDDDLYGLSPTYRLYPAQTGWIFLAVTTDREWQALGRLNNCQGLAADARFATEELRRQNAETLAKEITQLLSSESAAQWEADATACGIGLVEVFEGSPGAFFGGDEHACANGLALTVEHARFGKTKRWGPLVTVNGLQESYGPGALAGDQTDELLRELGYRSEEITRFREQRIVSSEPIGG